MITMGYLMVLLEQTYSSGSNGGQHLIFSDGEHSVTNSPYTVKTTLNESNGWDIMRCDL